MKRISPLFLFVYLALAEDYPFYEIKLTSDATQRYALSAQMATGSAAQNFSFVLTTGTPFLTVAGAGCSTCNNATSYNEQGSTTVQNLGNSANVSLFGGASTSGPLIKEDCFLHTKNGSNWQYPNQTIVMSNQSVSVYDDQVSGLFGLASGRATNNLNVSVVGGYFSRKPTIPSLTFGLALQPPSAKGSDNAGTLHWFGTDPDSYQGDITWMPTTITSNSDLATFQIDGWQITAGGTNVTNSSQNLASAVDPYYVNMFFPSQDAQRIHTAIGGSSSKPANDGQSTVYVVPCDSKYSLSTVIGGQTWEVDQTILVQKQDDGTCVSNIQGWADTSNKQYLFGSAFMSSFYVAIQITNPNGGQNDQIGFAQRASPRPRSIVGPVVGGVVGGVAGLVILDLAVFFCIRRCKRKNAPGP